MQTTLLGLAIAIILALLTALIGPFFVDWNQYRASVEHGASRVVGLPVRVNGPIAVRLLPTPTLLLSRIEIGSPGDGSTVRAQQLGFEFALAPLMRGKFHVNETRLVGPAFSVALDRAGHVHWAVPSIGFDPDAVSIEHLSIEDGEVTLSDAGSGARTVLHKLSFTGEVLSLNGPFKGDGSFVNGSEPYAYRLNAGRIEAGQGLHLHVGLDAADRPGLEADGTLSWQDGAPHFDGSLSVERPVGLARMKGKTQLDEPWRASAHVRATPAAALFEQGEFHYGSEERGFKLTGTAQLKFGPQPRFDAVISGRQIDIDRALAMPEVTGRPPLEAVKAIAAAFATDLDTSLPIQLGVSVDALTLGGTSLQAMRGDIRLAGKAVNLDRLEFRAPGFAQVQASGRFAMDAGGVLGFSGPVDVDAGDPRAFAAWLRGAAEPGRAVVDRLHARGDVTLAQDRLQVEHLDLEFQRQFVQGRVAYLFAAGSRPARLEADLQIPDIDGDQALAFVQTALAGSGLERPQEATLGLTIGHATIGGIDLRQAEARLHIDGNGVEVDKLSVGDLGGATVQASGAVAGLPDAPRGQLAFDLDGRSLAGVTAVLDKFAPAAAAPIRRLGDRLLPAKLHGSATFAAAAAGPGTLAKIALDGRAGVFALGLQGEGTGEIGAPAGAQVQFEARIDVDDGSALTAITGADRVIAVDKKPAKLVLSAKGPLNGDMRVDGRITAANLDLAAGGSVRVLGAQAPAGSLKLSAAADASPLRRQVGGADPLPVTLAGQLTVTPEAARFYDLGGKVAGTPVRARLTAAFGQPIRIDGAVETDALDASAAIAAAVGLPTQAGTRSEQALGAAEPFADWLYSDLAGQITVTTARATFTPTLVAQKVQARLRIAGPEISFDDMRGTLAGGQLEGQLTVHSGPTGLSARGRIALRDADATVLIPGERRPPISGRIGLQTQVGGDGLSPAALVGSLTGGGTLTLDRAQIAGINAKVFDTLTRAVDQGTMLDAPRIHDIVATAFDAGRIGVPHLEAAISLNAGRARTGTTIVPADGAELAVSGGLDLSGGLLDARVVVSGAGATADGSGERPDVTLVLNGPLTAPRRTLDVSALAGWLTLRAVEQQSRQLEAAEARRRAAESAEARQREAEAAAAAAAEAKRREQALLESAGVPAEPGNGDEASGAATVPSGQAAMVDRSQGDEPESTGTTSAVASRPGAADQHPAAGREGWLSSVAPSPSPAATLAPLPPPIEIKPVPMPAPALGAQAATNLPARPHPISPGTPPTTPARRAPPPPLPPLQLFNPSPNP